MSARPTLMASAVRCLAALLLLGGATAAHADDKQEAARTLDAFHAALAGGDAKAAMNLLAPDAAILESGFAESRADYEAHHLAEDIAFARDVHSVRSEVHVDVEGDAAWVTSHSRTEGSFQGKPVNSRGVELAVLTRNAGGWRIRAIHWSSHKEAQR